MRVLARNGNTKANERSGPLTNDAEHAMEDLGHPQLPDAS